MNNYTLSKLYLILRKYLIEDKVITKFVALGTSILEMSSFDITRLFGVKGYVAVVTGGSSGLGFMICKV